MKRVVILTGNETRHTYFRKKMADDGRFKVVASYCEGAEIGLKARTFANGLASLCERRHVLSREQSELDFFEEAIFGIQDKSNPVHIKKGDINSTLVVDNIKSASPDLIICYGSSLIKSDLLDSYSGKFINVHLGLSPYYRGSGTNVWPIINGELDMVGATFMYIDSGIDTGSIIHQIRADIFLGDGPHSIGNRLIKKMTKIYADLVAHFDRLSSETQPTFEGKLYKNSDFTAESCERLYQRFKDGVVDGYLDSLDEINQPYIVRNKGLS